MMAETTTTEKSFVINELLCYIQNNFASSTSAGLQTAISGFYTVEEITNAKSKLYEVVKKCTVHVMIYMLTICRDSQHGVQVTINGALMQVTLLNSIRH